MKKLILLAFLILSYISTTPSQSPSAVLKTANKALGGEKALKSIRSVSSSGTITRLSDGAKGRYESATSSQSLFTEKYDLGGWFSRRVRQI
jgi:hypothetical protein